MPTYPTMDQITQQKELAEALLLLAQRLLDEYNQNVIRKKNLRTEIKSLFQLIIVVNDLGKKLKSNNTILKSKLDEIEQKGFSSIEIPQEENSPEHNKLYQEKVLEKASQETEKLFQEHDAQYIKKQKKILERILIAADECYKAHKAENLRLKNLLLEDNKENKDNQNLIYNVESLSPAKRNRNINRNINDELNSVVTLPQIISTPKKSITIKTPTTTPKSVKELNFSDIDNIIDIGLPIELQVEERDGDTLSTDSESDNNTSSSSVSLTTPPDDTDPPPVNFEDAAIDDDYHDYLNELFSLKEEIADKPVDDQPVIIPEIINLPNLPLPNRERKKVVTVKPVPKKDIPEKPILPAHTTDKTFVTPERKKKQITSLKKPMGPSWKNLTYSPVSVSDIHSPPYLKHMAVTPLKSIITKPKTNDNDDDTEDLPITAKSFPQQNPVSYVERLNREHNTLTNENNINTVNILLAGAFMLAMLMSPILALFAAVAILTYARIEGINNTKNAPGISLA